MGEEQQEEKTTENNTRQMYKGQKVKVRTQTEKKIHDKCAHKTRTKMKNQLKTMCVVCVFHVYLCVCPNVCCAWTLWGAGMLCVWWVGGSGGCGCTAKIQMRLFICVVVVVV